MSRKDQAKARLDEPQTPAHTNLLTGFFCTKMTNNKFKRIHDEINGVIGKNVATHRDVSNIDFEFLPDTPIQAEEKDKLFFGYHQIASALGKIIKNAPAPFTIGLFGKWGTGKSTILNQLKNYLNDDTRLIVFDVWKYESDALRRSFILDVATQLNLDKDFIKKIKEKLYLDISRPREEFRWSWRSPIIFFLIFFSVSLIQFAYTSSLSLQLIYVSLLSSIIGSLSDLIKTTISVDKISISEDKVNSPEEFMLQFEEILSKIGNKRLVVAIDNLDRVDRDKAVELLGTIKTFLTSDKNKDKIIFIIPCDDRSIKEYLKSVYVKENQNSEFDPDEFLRKFFNAVLRIPKFLNLELDSYTETLLRQTKISKFINNQDLEQIINQTFRDNPREIKQFINNLITYYLIALERVVAKELDKSFIDKNLPFIAKLLIIRQRFPAAYNEIEEKTLREATTWQELTNNEIFGEEEDGKALREFLITTEWIRPSSSNIAIFMTLRRSEAEKSLPGWDQFLDAAINKRVDTAVKIIKRLKS